MGTHKASKRLKTAWLEPKEIEALQELGASLHVNFTELLQKIARGEIVCSRKSENKEAK